MNGLKSLGGQAPALFSEGLVASDAVIVSHGRDFLFYTVDQA
jgi:hypothetical protein